MLCILDGLGLNPRHDSNAVAQANTPTLSSLFASSPWTTLTTCGEQVGLPSGQMGNSEVGHLNIGAGRVVEQWLLRISRDLRSSFLEENPIFSSFRREISPPHRLHVVGLVSDGGVHSHVEHLELFLQKWCQLTNVEVLLHIISDGRDTAPQSAKNQIPEFLGRVSYLPQVRAATLIGRFFAMDRDKRWERTLTAYDLIVKGEGNRCQDVPAAIAAEYAAGRNDEFVQPQVFGDYQGVTQGDAILFWNFRADRMRQIVETFTSPDFNEFARDYVPFARSRALSFTEYDPKLQIQVLFPTITITNHLGDVLAKASLNQIRAAETEKYPHVTYFLNGGNEEPCPGEERILVPSPRDVKTYDLKPEMSAHPLTEAVIAKIISGNFHLLVLNFANCDMVGHTGDLVAATKAVEVVDECLGRLLQVLKDKDWQAVIIADHGNAEQMLDYETGEPHTAHTTFPVPCIVFNPHRPIALRPGGALCDVAPTVLELIGLEQPGEMTGKSLIAPES